jgi:VWFA-related protein
MKGAPAAWLVTGAAAAIVAAMTTDAPERRPLRSSVEVTVVTATVRDAEGRLAPGLPREAFEIYEDGAPVAITQFTNERVPLGLGLLLDISDSMFGRRIKDAEGAVERFLLTLLAPSDAFFVMAFNHEPRVLFGWKSTPDVRARPTACTKRSIGCTRAAAPRSTTRSTPHSPSSTTGRGSARQSF